MDLSEDLKMTLLNVNFVMIYIIYFFKKVFFSS